MPFWTPSTTHRDLGKSHIQVVCSHSVTGGSGSSTNLGYLTTGLNSRGRVHNILLWSTTTEKFPSIFNFCSPSYGYDSQEWRFLGLKVLIAWWPGYPRPSGTAYMEYPPILLMVSPLALSSRASSDIREITWPTRQNSLNKKCEQHGLL